VVVQPSRLESYSLVIPEAMACGCAVVAARLPAAPGLLDDGRTGFLYPPGDVAALREVLRRLLDDPALVARVGAAAAEEARARLGVEHEARALAQVYAEVALRSARR
jgi:mannosyltransferase